MKQITPTEMCLNETCHKGRNLSDAFRIQNGVKQGDDLSLLFSTLFYNMILVRNKKVRKNLN